jgi:hypothetical protein
MKQFVIVFSILTLAATAHAQGGHIGLYSDNSYVDCNLTEAVLAENVVYVAHSYALEGNTAQFRVIDHWGVTVTGVSYGTNLYLGDIFTGVVITYVGCKTLPHLLAEIRYFPTRETAPCIGLHVGADPAVASGEIEVIDCSSNVWYATGGSLCINYPECCLIKSASSAVSTECYPIAAATSTWGSIKALYR